MTTSDYYFGVDGCKTGWFYIGISDDDRFQFGVVESFDQISGFADSAKLILVDIPIGLLGEDHRERLCDTEARRAISPRGSTVFPAPARKALSQTSYIAASEENFRVLGRKLSRQSWAIAPKIAEVDRYMREQGFTSKIREMHPEVAFWALNQKTPILNNKKRREGFSDRLGVLAMHFSKAEECYSKARNSFAKKQVADDDILDAMVGAVTAGYSARLRTLPRVPVRDEFGLAMEMVYADLDCVFCKPFASSVLLEDEMVQCLWDGYPISPGHALIIPRRHVETWFEATDDEKSAMISAVDKVKEIIEQEHSPTAYNIGINSGLDAGQTIPHLHLHVIPRYPRDIEDARGGIRNVLPAKARWWERE